ncbi:MAG: hypothetical protein II126_05560 [Erysipelotrichaceae bacterium]|nr:hypothetical protein [Erysipelotrichaceae bacterium]
MRKKTFRQAVIETLKEFDKLEYIKDYNKNNYRNVAIRIRKDNTAVLQKLDSVPSKNSYIISLIEEDIRRNP